MGFSDKIVCEANKIYFEVTKGQIFRGNSRKAIVFASIFHAYKLSGKPQSHDKLIQVFNLNRKNGLKGLKHINLYAPKTSTIRTTYITPVNLIEEIMDKFSATPEQKQEVVTIYNQIKNKSSRLNRSRPQSVACGLIFYWIKNQQKDITIKQFTKKVNLSELTINKIATEIEEVINNENIAV
jgi:transcription initiation factor TFIIIB Brf1 subunit/transcription initiation factor TFIIB